MSDIPTPRTEKAWQRVLAGPTAKPLLYEARNLERELTAALARLADIEAGTIHTCHDHCQRPECVLRRERDEARRDLSAARKVIEDLVAPRVGGDKKAQLAAARMAARRFLESTLKQQSEGGAV